MGLQARLPLKAVKAQQQPPTCWKAAPHVPLDQVGPALQICPSESGMVMHGCMLAMLLLLCELLGLFLHLCMDVLLAAH